MKSAFVLLRSQLGRSAGFTLVGAGALVLFAGYRGVATSIYVAEQLTYVVSGGLVGLFLLGIGATLLISSDLHDEWRKLAHIEDAINRLTASFIGVEKSSGEDGPPLTEGQSSNGYGDSMASQLAQSIASRNADEMAAGTRDGGGFAKPSILMGWATAATGAGLLMMWDRAASVSEAKKALMAVVLASGILIAFGVVMLAGTVWQRRLVQTRQAALLGSFPAAAARLDLFSRETVEAIAPAGREPADVVLVGQGLSLYHRVGCPAVAGVAVTELSREATPSHLQPCGICDA